MKKKRGNSDKDESEEKVEKSKKNKKVLLFLTF